MLLRAGTSKDRSHLWNCKCECGLERVVYGPSLTRGRSKSCGCRPPQPKHGMCGTPEYHSWEAMKQRCCNPSHPNYQLYGGRGIRVCCRWMNSFENFLSDMGPRLNPLLTLERKNNNGNYTPKNCIWATRQQQSSNTRRTRVLAANGRHQVLARWSEELGIPKSSLRRLLSNGNSMQEIFKAHYTRA